MHFQYHKYRTAVIKNCFLGDKRMIEIYDLNDKLIARVSNQDQLDEFMDDNEFEYPEVIIKENGKKRKYTFEDSEFESTKSEKIKIFSYEQDMCFSKCRLLFI